MWHCAELLFHHIRHRKWNVCSLYSLIEQVNTTVNSTVSLLSFFVSVKHFWGCICHYLHGAHARILLNKGKYLNMGVSWKEVFGKPVWNRLNTSPLTLKKDDKSSRKIKERSTSLSSLLFWLSLKAETDLKEQVSLVILTGALLYF